MTILTYGLFAIQWIMLSGLHLGIWSILKEQSRSLKKIAESWNKLTIKEIRKSIASWKKRLRAVGQADGYATEHLRL